MTQQRKAFVSSTYEDLKLHRAYVIDALRDAGIHVDPMENWTADSNEPKSFSQERVAGCDLCILLIARRRGSIPEGEAKSITQLEYDFAIKNGLDLLVFALDDKALWHREFDELDKDPQLRDWLQYLHDHHGVSYFSHEPGSVQVAPAISRLVAKADTEQHRLRGAPTLDDIRRAARRASDDYLDKMQRERVYLPNLYARRLELETHLSGFLDRKCTKSGMLIIGTSGIGKTNTLCHIVKHWRDDAAKLGSDVVLFIGGSTLPGGNFVLRDVLMDRLDLTDSFSTFVSAFTVLRKETNAQVVVIVDGVDKHPQPAELLRQLDDLIVRTEDVPWLKVVVSIGEVTYGALRQAGFIPALRGYYTVNANQRAAGDESTQIMLGRMTDEELADAYTKYQHEPGTSPTSPFESLTEEFRNAVRNPLFLRIVMEVFNGRRLPRRVLTAEVLLEYCTKTIFTEPTRTYFVNRLVDVLYNNRWMAVSFDVLASDPDLRPMVLDQSSQSPYLQLLDEQVIEEQFKRVSPILPAQKFAAFTYDRLLEYLLLNRAVERFGITSDTVQRLSEQAVDYLPLRGVITTLLVTKVDEGDIAGVVAWLRSGNPEIMKHVALELLVELEQRVSAPADAPEAAMSTDPVGRLVAAMLVSQMDWSSELLTSFATKLMTIGFFRRAAFVLESLTRTVSEQQTPRLAAAIRQGLGTVKSVRGDKRGALADCETALRLYRAVGDRDGEQDVLDAIARVYFDLGELPAARDYFERSLIIDREQIAATGSDEAYEGQAQSLLGLSEVYHRMGEIGKAITFGEEARDIYAAIEDQRGLAATLNQLGILRRRRGLTEQASECHRRALSMYQQLGDKRGVAQCLPFLALTYQVQGAWSDALAHCRQALLLYEDMGDEQGVAYTYNSMGETYRWQGQLDEALEAYGRALELFTRIDAKRYVAMCLSNLGATHLAAGRYEEATELLKGAQTLEKDCLGIEGDPETLSSLSAASLGLGHADNALAYSDAAVASLHDRQFGEEDVQLVYYYRYKILGKFGRYEEAREALGTAHSDVLEQSNGCKNPEDRHTFMQSFPLRRNIVEAWRNATQSRDS